MFFGKNPYTGYSSVSLLKMSSLCLWDFDVCQPVEVHYKYVTKKKIHNTHDEICECC